MPRWFDVVSSPASVGAGPVRPARRGRRLVTSVAAFTGAMLVSGVAVAAGAPATSFGGEHVGQSNAHGVLLPNNQWVRPLGSRILTQGGRLIASTISPDGTKLAALTYQRGTGFLSVFDLSTGTLLQQVGTGATGDPKIGDGTVAADGPLYSADGRTLWFPQTADLLRFAVGKDGRVVPAPATVPLTDRTTAYLPSGLALSPDGRSLYVALNGANTLGVIDTATSKLVAQIPVGVAPRQVVLVGGQAFVSNEGGRRTTSADTSTNLTNVQETPGTPVVSDPSTGAVDNGTLSVVDLATRRQTSTIKVGLEPTALTLTGTTLFVANSNDDSMSVVDTATRKVTQTVNVNPLPGSTVGSYPNSIAVPDPQHVVVSIGRDNALAVYRFNGATSPMQYVGLVPTDFYPVGVAYDQPLGRFVVTNDKGIGSRGPTSTVTEGPDANPATGHNTYNDTGSLTTFAPPSEAQLGTLTHQVFQNNDWQHLLDRTPIGAAPAATQPVAIPAKLGDPSAIQHVFLIVKENRTYDQVLGDLGKGNGDPTLTQFGGSVTPNLHTLASTFGDFDNFYDEGTLSADGHNWLMQADANDYIEKEFGSFYRSYPAQGGDALAYQRDGFLWNAAAAAGKSVSNFGEYNNYFNVAPADDVWSKWYQDSQILEGKASGPLPIPVGKYKTYADIPSLNAITDPTYPRFDTNVPDQYRTDIWLRSFQQSKKTGSLANLTMMWVPDDHTAGTSGASPYPTAAVADNDLAVGRIVDAISHSQFWSSSAVFVLEDDSQAGVDHVDGHRSPLWIASPYAARGVVDSSYYSQLNVVKTIEQILGIAPMNQEDRAAEPMFDAFTNTPDDSPFVVRPNQIPLTYGLKSAAATPPVPASASAVAAQWQTWSAHQKFAGSLAAEDSSNPAQLNRLDWYASTGWVRPYPGDTAILGPYQVPGWDNPPADLG